MIFSPYIWVGRKNSVCTYLSRRGSVQKRCSSVVALDLQICALLMCDMTHSHEVAWRTPTCGMPHAYEWYDTYSLTFIDTHSYVSRDSFIHATWLIHTCDMTHSREVTWRTPMPHAYSWYATHSLTLIHWHSFIRVTWLIQTCDETLLFLRCHPYPPDLRPIVGWHDSFIQSGITQRYVWYASCIRVVQHSFVDIHWHSCIRVTWLIHTCDVTPLFLCCHPYPRDLCLIVVWQYSFVQVTWRTHTCGMTHSYEWHDAFMRVV